MTEDQKNIKKEIIFEHVEKIDTLKPKYGLDSCIIVYSVAYPKIYKNQCSRIFNRKGIFYIHELSLKDDIEVKKILVKEYDFSKSRVNKELNQFLKDKNIQIVSTNKAKRELAVVREDMCNNDGMEIHSPDTIIISDFKEFGITKTFSEDDDYVKASNHLGLPAERILFKLDPEIQKRFGKLKHFKIKEK